MNELKYDETKVIELIIKHKGNVSSVAKSLKCSRTTIQHYANNNPVIAEALQDAREEITDIAESKLFAAIRKGQAWAICFYLKTQGKSRGYIERQEVTGAEGKAIQIEWHEALTDDDEIGIGADQLPPTG